MFKKLRIILIAPALLLILTVSAFASEFTDVPDSHWAKAEISDFSLKGIIGGDGNGTFAPNEVVTREQFAKMFTLTFNMPFRGNNQQSFNDVSVDRWSYKYIEACKAVLNSYPDSSGAESSFKPQDYATREDIAVSLVKILGFSENDAADSDTAVKKFSDNKSISQSLLPYICIATENALIKGYANGTFAPQKGVTRAEAVALLYRAKQAQINTIIATVGGVEISLEEFSNAVKQSFDYFKSMDFDMSEMLFDKVDGDKTASDILKDEAMRSFTLFAALDKVANDNNIILTDEDEKIIADKRIKDIDSSGGYSEFLNNLRFTGVSEGYYNYVNRYSMLYTKINESLFKIGKPLAPSEESVISSILNDYVRVKHILIQATEENTNEKLKIAQDVLERVKAGENFDSLIDEFNEDPGMDTETNGYVFTEGKMAKEFEDASFALEENQTSEIVKTNYGFHIINRLELTKEFIEENIEQYSEEFCQSALQEKLQETEQDIEVIYTERFSRLNLAPILGVKG